MDKALKKKLCERLLWYFGMSEFGIKKVSYVSMEEWAYIERWVDCIFEGFLQRLIVAHPNLSRADLRLCCLLRLKLCRSHIASLMGISSSSVSTSKLRIKRKIGIRRVDSEVDRVSLESYLFAF